MKYDVEVFWKDGSKSVFICEHYKDYEEWNQLQLKLVRKMDNVLAKVIWNII